MKTRLAALLILLSFVLPPVAAAATAGPVFGLRAVGNPKRGYFIYNLAPGATRTGAVIVSNTGNRTGTVKLYSADGSTGQTTGTVYLTDSKPVHAGAWVKLAQPSVRLAPGEIKRVPFTVQVPASHVGPGPVGREASSPRPRRRRRRSARRARPASRSASATRRSSPCRSTCPDLSAPSFTIGGVKTGGQRGFQQVLVHFSNDGNMLLKPTGSVTILQGGKAIEHLPFKMDTFLPQTAIDYPVLLKKALAAGEYQTNVSLSYPTPAGGRKTITASPTLKISDENVKQVFTSAAPQQPPGGVVADSGSSTPWALIGGVAAAVLLLLLAVWLLLRRRRRGGDDDDDIEVDEPRQVLPPLAPAAPARAEPPVVPVEPTPPVAPTPAPPAEQAAPAAPAAAAAAARPASPACDPHHYWEVAYERGALGDDGVWRFPHRCRNCGLELLATDIADASAQAEQGVH